MSRFSPTPRFSAGTLSLGLAVALAVGALAGPAVLDSPLEARETGPGEGGGEYVGTLEDQDPEVPTFKYVTGHDFGDRITLNHQSVRYLEAVAEASPRVTLLDQGESWEGRRLVAAVVTSPANHERLDEILRNAARLEDARQTSREEAERIIEDQPAVVWLGGSIHGFELSGAEGLLKLFQDLTTRDDATVREVLENTVVVIDPILNPDGRDAFAHRNHQSIGRVPNPERDDWANDFTIWEALKYRTSHYYFDINRDWFAHTHPETRNRVPTLREFRPQAAVDAHEMSPDVEFFFDPPTLPLGEYFPDYARRGFQLFNERYVAAFDSAGFEYMTEERYNYLYPGYTTAYSSYQGAVGMLFEQGSSRGLALTRPDGSVRTLGDATEQQYVAAWATLRTAVEERERLLRDYHEAGREALADGRQGVRRYLLPPQGDPGGLAEAVNLLRRSGIEVSRLESPARLDGVRDRAGRDVGSHSFPAGTYVVEVAQPRNRLIRVLLGPEVAIEAEFLEEARERVERDENPRFYDITSFSLPLLFDLEAYGSTDGRTVSVAAVEDEVGAAAPPEREAGYAYLIDGRQAAAPAALHHLAARGHRVAMLEDSTRVEDRSYASGTVIARVGQNEPALHEDVREVAGKLDLRVRAVDTGRAEPGHPSLGSGSVIPVPKPEIALVAEDGVHPYSFGWTWHLLDRTYGIPVTVLHTRSLSGISLDRFDVLVLPDLASAGLFGSTLDEAGQERLKRWVREGGVLVTLGDATEFVREELELLSLRSWYDEAAGEGEEEPYRFDVPGAFLRGEVDGARWLASGAPSEVPVLVRSSRLLLPPEGPPGSGRRAVVTFADEGLRLSGHAWPESLERLPGTVYLYEERHGAGRVVAFSEDPAFRGYWRGADRLFLNAVLVGHAAP